MSALPPISPDARLPSLEGLRAFEAAARCGTFERAADELAITASAVGKRIGALEELLGVALFQRGAKALALSAAGKEYLAQVREALSLLASVPLHQRSTQRRERLRISAPPTFAREILVPALPDFCRLQPQVELELMISVPYLDLASADAELEVCHAPLGTFGPEVPPLWHDLLVPLASPRLLATQPAPRTAADIGQLPLLRTPLDPWLPWFRAQGLDWPEPAAGPRFVDLGLTLVAARCAQGVALGRPALAGQWLRSGELVPVLGPGRTPTVVASSAYHLVPSRDISPAAEAFAGWLRETGARLAAEALALV